MSHEDPGNISYSEVGGLSEQIRELREVCLLYCVWFEIPRRCIVVIDQAYSAQILAKYFWFIWTEMKLSAMINKQSSLTWG